MQSLVVPPLPKNLIFLLNCCENARHFTEFFSQQCKFVVNSSVLPSNTFFYYKRNRSYIIIQDVEILHIIRNLNPNKATGSGIPSHMLLLCDDYVLPPLKLIFQNILTTSTYPDMWEPANVTPNFKKGDIQLNYRST